jgi:uncharacterized protein with HEPN domain
MPPDRDYAADILAAARLVQSYAERVSQDEFNEDNMRQDAVVRQLLIIGEAAKRLSDDFKSRHANIPWRQMAGMRDILVHSYDHVDLDQVWRVATEELDALVAAIEPLVQADE